MNLVTGKSFAEGGKGRMSTGAVAALSLILLLALIFFGVHLSTSLMFTSVLSVFLFTGRFSTAMNVLTSRRGAAVRQYMFGVIPLFVLMGLLANVIRRQQDLYDSASLLLKKVRGGVGIATVIAKRFSQLSQVLRLRQRLFLRKLHFRRCFV